ncbi:glycosyl hydrolase family 92 [Colletotrichum graminicola M1.001]|uniref:Glycosyl hydrolase family 92 n=1 Tax=Colletotrichum graminicola (strain M1.001 / M2 / FGSC 10212) TaxID=645133 RepID=E3QRS6_COLGM|nr:glycosyl hydrolase family 92 [Colletotrichum graminicola M1.001]EFQ33564.1 glycosyl hydrolase family 92 [Colletotrichum graminicola M1.001]
MGILIPVTRLSRPVRLLIFAAVFVCLFRWWPSESRGLSSLFYSDLNPKVQHDVLKYVNPLIGTINGGHVFPGASLPYGMAKACADTDSHAENAAGWVSDSSKITGFSHLHDSGTGGSPSLGNFPLFPHPGCKNDDYLACKYTTEQRSLFRVNDSVVARPGYFSVHLTNTVRAEMTASERTALYRFSFSPNDTVSYADTANHGTIDAVSSPLILIDLTDIAQSRTSGGIQVYESGRVIGDGMFRPSFGQGNYRAFFCADFRGATIRKSGVFEGENPREDPKHLAEFTRGIRNPTGAAGAWLHFERPKNHQILARVGLSFVSVDKACQNAENEIPLFDFDGTVRAAESAWSEKLSVVELDTAGVGEDMKTTFWSGLYRSLLSPQNYTGENPLWESSEPYFDSFYCIWDSFRAQHPLLTIVDPEAQTQMVRALLDIYRFTGKLPDCRMSFCKGFSQGGSNADVVIADAYLKNMTTGVDWKTAYEAVVSDAEVAPQNFGVEGRGNLESWFGLGYIAQDHMDKLSSGPNSRSISRTVEYAYDDFCIAEMAQGLGHKDDYAKYMQRSANWQNLWKPDAPDIVVGKDRKEVERTKYTGFLMPKLINGSFTQQNTRICSPNTEQHLCYFDTAQATYEGSPWLYSFFAPQDMATLISLMGGREAFVDRLEYYHSGNIVYMGNEQAFLTVFQFHYAGRPGLSSRTTRSYIPSQFNASINGIPGNDDCAMGAFSALAMMGFFPVAGQDVYLLIPPFFPEVRLKTRGARLAVIRKVAVNDRELADGIYIQSATLDGKPYTKNWISHEFFYRGGTLELTVGSKEGDWGTREEDVPPSYPAAPKTKPPPTRTFRS